MRKKTANDFGELIKFQFIDSYRFMAESLDKLSSILESNKKTILHSTPCKIYKQIPLEDYQLLERNICI